MITPRWSSHPACAGSPTRPFSSSASRPGNRGATAGRTFHRASGALPCTAPGAGSKVRFMRNHTPSSITDTVLDQMAGTPSPRLKMLMEVGIRHLHAFAREANLTPQEWLQFIEFLTRVGKTCTPTRQEFILLSDVLGLSTMVNALHDATAVESATRTSLLGPFFREDSPELELGDQICRRDVADPILLWGRVCNASGAGIANAKVMVWQTSAAGVYDLQEGDGSAID